MEDLSSMLVEKFAFTADVASDISSWASRSYTPAQDELFWAWISSRVEDTPVGQRSLAQIGSIPRAGRSDAVISGIMLRQEIDVLLKLGIAKTSENDGREAAFNGLISALQRKLGSVLTLESWYMKIWRSDVGDTFKINISKPRGSSGFAYITYSTKHADKTWLVVTVAGSRSAWLIPMSKVRDIASAYASHSGQVSNEKFDIFIGKRDGRDKLWIVKDDTVDIEEFKLRLD